jgi:hypothetical protein
VFGQTADALRGEAVAVYQAYAEYLAPVGPGFLIRAGRFASPLRVEPVQAMHRFNITEGLVAGLLHPDTHTGATISTQIGPIRMMAGGANDTLLDPEGDLGDGKAVLFGAGFDVSETITVDASGIWGDSNSGPGIIAPTHVKWKEMGIAGAVVRWFPSDLLTTYVNFTYVWADSPVGVVGPLDETIRRISGDPEAYAVVVGSHYMVSDQTSFSFRGEAVWGKNNILDPTLSRSESPCKDLPVPGPPAPTRCQRADQQIWSLTGTIDHSFTEHVGFRVEARLDAGTTRGSGADDNLYQDRNGLRNHQWTTGVEAYYRF